MGSIGVFPSNYVTKLAPREKPLQCRAPVNINSVHGDGIIELLRDQVKRQEKGLYTLLSINCLSQIVCLFLIYLPRPKTLFTRLDVYTVSVQGVKSLGGHFACLCRGFEFYEVKKTLLLFFKKKMEILVHF